MVCEPRLLDDTNDTSEDIINEDVFDLLKEFLLCPVCYDIARNPVRVKQCLHKFCMSCIDDYNRKFKRSCPGCRHEINTRRQLKADYRINGISNYSYVYKI